MKSIYDFSVKTISGEEKSLADYKGKVMLIVNTASKCGFTYQYDGLEALYKKYKDKGFVVLGFPSNQFLHQEPGSDSEIASFCRLNHGVTFPLFAKGDVRGENAQPLFKFLTSKCGFMKCQYDCEEGKDLLDFLKSDFPSFILGDSIKWNFTKFLVNREGEVVARFEPITKPEKIEASIEKLL